MFKTILVPIDFEQDGSWERAVDAAFALARAEGAKLHIMHVIRSAPAVVAQYLPKEISAPVRASLSSPSSVSGYIRLPMSCRIMRIDAV
jgi:nucleotide-binding universal stress UspA family protein